MLSLPRYVSQDDDACSLLASFAMKALRDLKEVSNTNEPGGPRTGIGTKGRTWDRFGELLALET